MVLGLGMIRNRIYTAPDLMYRTAGYAASFFTGSKANVPDTFVDKALHTLVEFVEKETPALARKSDRQVEEALKKWTVKGKRDFGKVVGASTGALLASMLVTAYLLTRPAKKRGVNAAAGTNNRSVVSVRVKRSHPTTFKSGVNHPNGQGSYWAAHPNAA
jgi:hypothetical protein